MTKTKAEIAAEEYAKTVTQYMNIKQVLPPEEESDEQVRAALKYRLSQSFKAGAAWQEKQMRSGEPDRYVMRHKKTGDWHVFFGLVSNEFKAAVEKANPDYEVVPVRLLEIKELTPEGEG